MGAQPEIIKNYLNLVSSDYVPKLSRVNFHQAGTFFLSPDSEGMKFRASETVSLLRPELSWKAKMKYFKLPLVVRDQLKGNKGRITAKLFSIITVMNIEDEEILIGELIRYLAEIPWYPQALRTLKNLKYEIISDKKVKVTIHLGKVKASVTYEFDENGFICAVSSSGRFMEVDGQKVNYPWGGTFSGYDEFSDVLVPGHAEAYWDLPEGRFTYFRCSLFDYVAM